MFKRLENDKVTAARRDVGKPMEMVLQLNPNIKEPFPTNPKIVLV